jgi:DNA-binding MarR family transcriptional regulator
MSADERAEAQLRVWRGLREFVLDPGARKAQVAAELGISFSRTRALRRLLAAPLTLKQLAAALATDAPYATLIVDDLAELGLVERQPHPEDRRAKLVILTAEGRAVAERAAQILDAPPAAVTGLDDADLAALDRIVAGFRIPD